MSLAEVEQARVHITFPKESVFLDSQQPAKASVLVKIRPGAHLAPQNVQAIDHLVASAVEGLSPDAVSVLDMNGNLLGRPKAAGGLDGADPSEAALEYRHKVEADLLAKIDSTLEPLLGAEKFRAGVSVDCDFTGGEQSEELYDPARSVMLSSQRTEDNAGSAFAGRRAGNGFQFAAAHLAPGERGGAQLARNGEHHLPVQPHGEKDPPAGRNRAQDVAGGAGGPDLSWQKDKNGYQRVLAAPSADKLKVVRDLVAGVTGFNAERGDQIVVETLPFESTLRARAAAAAGRRAAGAARPGAFGLTIERKTLRWCWEAAVALIVLGFVAALLAAGKAPRASAGRRICSVPRPARRREAGAPGVGRRLRRGAADRIQAGRARRPAAEDGGAGAERAEAGAGDHQDRRSAGQAPAREDQEGAGNAGAGPADLDSRGGSVTPGAGDRR